MKIVNQKAAHKQFHCRLVTGVLVFEKSITVAGGSNNYPDHPRVVVGRDEVQREWLDYYSCQKSTHSSANPAVVTSAAHECQANRIGVNHAS